MRLTIEGFAAKLGVSSRIVSKWEAGADSAHPGPTNQEALDTLLSFEADHVHDRFAINASLTISTGETLAASGPATDGAVALPEDSQIRHPGDGKLMNVVAAGMFLSGPAGDEPVWLDQFHMDVYPVTNAEYGRFVAATSYKAPQDWPGGTPPDDQRDHPVVYVDWNDANTYAEWAGKTLPTALQWEKAARGTRGELYPRGSGMTPAKCNTRESGIRSTTPVDRYHSGVSSYGIYDLCGNVWEWCSTETDSGRRALKGSAFTSPFPSRDAFQLQ